MLISTSLRYINVIRDTSSNLWPTSTVELWPKRENITSKVK